jgi:aromatic ring-cleaving dioxygenase
MSTEFAPYHAHIYYELDDRATAECLHQEFSNSKGLGNLATDVRGSLRGNVKAGLVER